MVTIERQGDRLTVRIARAPLHVVLTELRRQVGIESEWVDPTDTDTVSESFSGLPLAEAIGRLLNGRSFLIGYGTSRAARVPPYAVPLQLIVIPRGHAVSSVGQNMTTSDQSPQ